MSFLAKTRNPGGLPKNPGCLIKSGMTRFKYSLFRTRNQCHSWFARESGGTAKEPWMPDQVRHDTVEVFFVPYTESMSFLAKTRNPGGLPKNPGCLIKSGMTQLKYSLFRTQNQCHSWRRPGIQGDCQRTPGCLIKSGMTRLKYSLFRTQNQCHSWRRPGIRGDCQRTPGCLIKSGMTQLKYSLFRTQNQCHSWRRPGIRGDCQRTLDA